MEWIRIILYIIIVVKAATTDVWIALGFATIFAAIEVAVYALNKKIEKSKDELAETIIEEVLKQLNDTPSSDDFSETSGLSFSSNPLTEDEKALLDEIKNGNKAAVESFLKGRCESAVEELEELPFPIKVFLVAKVASIISSQESENEQKLADEKLNEWSDLITDNKE